jgi:hypothetical protein
MLKPKAPQRTKPVRISLLFSFLNFSALPHRLRANGCFLLPLKTQNIAYSYQSHPVEQIGKPLSTEENFDF